MVTGLIPFLFNIQNFGLKLFVIFVVGNGILSETLFVKINQK